MVATTDRTEAAQPGLDWPQVEVEVELVSPDGYQLPAVTDQSTTISRAPQVTVKARQMPAGEGRTHVALSDGGHLRVPNADAEQIKDGQILAAGQIGLRVVSRRSADLDRENHQLTVDASTRERLAEFTLLKVAPARIRQGQDQPDAPRRSVTATSSIVPAGAGF